MAVLLYLLLIVIAFVVHYHVKYRRRNHLLSKIPAMPSYPLIGSNLSFMGKSPEQILIILADSRKELGPIFRFDFSPYNSTYYITDPKIVEGILSSQKLIEKSVDYFFLEEWLGDGLLMSQGKKWFQRRKIITPTFHFKILEDFYQVMHRQGQIFIRNIEKSEGQVIDVFRMVGLYALDVICETAMGHNMKAQIDEDSEYVRAVKDIAEVSVLKIFDIIHRIQFLHRFTKLYKQEQKAMKILHEFTDSVIIKRRAELEKSLSTNNSSSQENEFGIKKKMAFLDLLLQATIDGQPLSNADVREEVDTFMFEGHDTTTSGIAFCLYNLALYPEIQKEVFEECEKVLSDDPEEPSTMSQMSGLNYLECVIKESQRIFPSVPLFGRQIKEEVIVNGFTLAENTVVNFSPFLMGRNPDVFPEPMKFDPSRFSVELDAEKRNPFAYIPFSAGPRNCIGQKFAMLEMKSIVSKVVRNFEILIKEENKELILCTELIMRPKHGIKLQFKKRQ